MSVEAVLQDLTKVELVGLFSELLGDDELTARIAVARYRWSVACDEQESIAKRQQRALARGDLRGFDQLERLREAARLRARKALAEYEHLARQQQSEEARRVRPTLEPELEDTDVPSSTSAGRRLVAGERVVVDIAQAEFDDEPADALPLRPIGLPHKPARLGLRR